MFELQSILVVDDSPVQRAFAIEMCKKLGIPVVHQAENGAAALELLHTLDTPPDIAVVDLEMPEMDGMALLQRLHEEDIDLPVIIASSRGESLIASAGAIASSLGVEILGVLQKPIDQQAFAKLIIHFSATHD